MLVVLGELQLAYVERGSLWFGAMAGDLRRRGVRIDADGVRTEQLARVRAGTWLVVGAAAIVAVLLLIASMRSRPSAEQEPTGRESAAAPPNHGRAPAPPAGPGQSRRVPGGAPPQPERVIAPQLPPAAGNAAQPPADAETETAFGNTDSDEPSGIALFPPMGSKPILGGFIVPDGFELPPGYVRHHQVTDDGEDVPPILMFHPDYHPVDANGDPIALPENRVVPRDMVPPGMPLQMLEVPDSQGPADAPP